MKSAITGKVRDMANVEQIEDWLGREALDLEDEKVGKLDEVYYSKATGDAVFASIKSGLLGRHSSLVPLAGASVGRDYVRLAYSAKQIEQAGSDINVHETVNHDDARRLGELYGIALTPDDDFESSSVINARLKASAEARQQAEDLEEQARQRAAEATQAQGEAHGAEQDAAVKAEEFERARAEADRARAEAERITPP
jgi:hypothetical protein